MIRIVKTAFPFNGLPKGHVFTYDTMDEEHARNMMRYLNGGYLIDITEGSEPDTVVIEMPSIETAEEVGDFGEGADQSPEGGSDDATADDAGSATNLQGDEGAVTKVAKKR